MSTIHPTLLDDSTYSLTDGGQFLSTAFFRGARRCVAHVRCEPAQDPCRTEKTNPSRMSIVVSLLGTRRILSTQRLSTRRPSSPKPQPSLTTLRLRDPSVLAAGRRNTYHYGRGCLGRSPSTRFPRNKSLLVPFIVAVAMRRYQPSSQGSLEVHARGAALILTMKYAHWRRILSHILFVVI